MKYRLLNYMGKIMLFLFGMSLISSCVTESKSDEKRTISILYSSKADFAMDYDNALQRKFDNVQIEIIEYEPILGEGVWNALQFVPRSGEEWNVNAFIELIEDKKPDILFFPVSISPSLLEKNMLKDVTTYIQKYDFSEIDAPILQTLQMMGEGRYYFLSNSMASQAIYYNKDLFLKYGVSEPTDFMEWNEVLHRSEQISLLGKEEGVIGLQTPSYSMSDLFLHIGRENGLSWYDPVNKRASFSSSSWKAVLEQIVRMNQTVSGLPVSSSELFVNGKVAMVLDTFKLKDDLDQSRNELNWGLVTAPVAVNDKNKSSSISIQYLNSISNETDQFEDALEVWAYLNGKVIARNSHNINYFRFTIPVRSNLIRDDEMRNVASFFKLSPHVPLGSTDSILPIKAQYAVKRFLEDQIQQITNGGITMDEAVTNWDTEVLTIINPFHND